MTQITELLAKGPTYSFEFFPPKSDSEHATLATTLRDLQPLDPSFVSVTYRGGAESRQRTLDLVSAMLHTTSLVPMAHLICVAHSRLELADILVTLRKSGIENLMALGGDPPQDQGGTTSESELAHAVELVELARAVGGFSIGVAAHPSGHPASKSLKQDRDYLAEKLDKADFAITQFFFEISEYESLRQDLLKRGVVKPILPGIMPITSLASIPRMAAMGSAVPDWLVERLNAAKERAERAQGNPQEAVREVGVQIATELCQALLESGAPGLHFYTLNRSSATREIYSALGLGPSSV